MENGTHLAFIQATGAFANENPKGFLCPPGQLCLEGSNPYNGTISFDNIFTSALQVIVVTSCR